jgi:hypothetical protein
MDEAFGESVALWDFFWQIRLCPVVMRARLGFADEGLFVSV